MKKQYIEESENQFMINIPIAGILKENIDIETSQDVLTIKAKRNIDIPEGYQSIHKDFDVNQDIELSFKLSTDINQSTIKAELEKGYLQITLPKVEEALPKKVLIS